MILFNGSNWSLGWFQSPTAKINQVPLPHPLNDTWGGTNFSKWLPFSPTPTGSWGADFNRESAPIMLPSGQQQSDCMGKISPPVVPCPHLQNGNCWEVKTYSTMLKKLLAPIFTFNSCLLSKARWNLTKARVSGKEGRMWAGRREPVTHMVGGSHAHSLPLTTWNDCHREWPNWLFILLTVHWQW